jgi:hypothetical protein
MDARLLFPSLPPELRNLIYSNTIHPSNPLSNTNLPFTSKTYTFSHTKVAITPVHSGNPNLLALDKFHFQEAREYHSYLLNHAIQLHICILFNGHTNTFVQEHWDKKVGTHLKNLLKKFPWLAKVVDYDVQILWEPRSWDLGRKKRSIGGVAQRMVNVLTKMMDEKARKRSVLKAELRIGHSVACDYSFRQQSLGLADFVSDDTLRPRSLEVEIALGVFRTQKSLPGRPSPRLKDVSGYDEEDRLGRLESCLVFKKEVERNNDGTVAWCRAATEPMEQTRVFPMVFMALAGECAQAVDG